jgi:hypothetical protein
MGLMLENAEWYLAKMQGTFWKDLNATRSLENDKWRGSNV